MTAEEQLAVLSLGAEEILPEGALLERLRQSVREGRPLRVKQGFDPTAPDIHLGHAVGLRVLKRFQDLGHQVVLIVGDCTGMVGDPSGRSKARPQLTAPEVEANARTYLEQFYRVLERDPSPPRRPVEVHRNGEWFSKMSFMEVLRLAAQFTVAQVLERDDFAKRYAARQPIGIHELYYPIMQGYDSVAIRSDVELGATEQKFNLMVGRWLQESHGQPPQIALTVPVLPGLDGVQRMSKSLGNYIGVAEPPGEMFGKVMSLPDTAMTTFWRLTTDATPAEIAAMERALADSTAHPMEIKRQLGERLVRMYHGAEAAARARADFDTQFSKRGVPQDIEEYGWGAVEQVRGDRDDVSIIEHLVASGIATTRSAARRLVEQGAVSVDGKHVADSRIAVDRNPGFVLRAGRKMKRYNPLG